MQFQIVFKFFTEALVEAGEQKAGTEGVDDTIIARLSRAKSPLMVSAIWEGATAAIAATQRATRGDLIEQ